LPESAWQPADWTAAPSNPREQEKLTDLLTAYLPALAVRQRVLHITLPSHSARVASAVRGLLSLVQLEELQLAAEPQGALWPDAEVFFAPLPHGPTGFRSC
jgi:hypothetical protein